MLGKRESITRHGKPGQVEYARQRTSPAMACHGIRRRGRVGMKHVGRTARCGHAQPCAGGIRAVVMNTGQVSSMRQRARSAKWRRRYVRTDKHEAICLLAEATAASAICRLMSTVVPQGSPVLNQLPEAVSMCMSVYV